MKMILVLALCLVGPVLGLYEDQAFKFDWRKRLIGDVQHLEFYGTEQDPVIIVGTKKNVVAALDSDNGKIIWRHKFEEDEMTGIVRTVAISGKYAVSVSGSNDLYLRLWDPQRGALIQEHMIRVKTVPDLVHVTKSKLWTVNYQTGSVEVLSYYFDTKKLGDPVSQTVQVPDHQTVLKCVVNGQESLVCASTDGLLVTNLKSPASFQYQPFPAIISPEAAMSLVSRGNYVQIDSNNKLFTFTASGTSLEHVDSSDFFTSCPGLKLRQECKEVGIDSDGIEYCQSASSNVIINYNGSEQPVKISEERGRIKNVWSECSGEDEGFQLLLTFEDGSLVSLTPRGNVMFTREEGLATIQKIELVGMGLQDQQFQLKSVYSDSPDISSVLDNFVNRIKRHISYLEGFIVSLINFEMPVKSKTVSPDRFGLKKIIVAVTRANKIYGIDSMSGEIVWQTMFPGTYNYDLPVYKSQTYLLVQKDGRSGDYAQAMLVYKHVRSSYHVMTFNPLTGAVVSNLPLDLNLDQAFLLPELPEHEMKAVLFIGKDGKAKISPTNAITCIKNGPELFVTTRTDTGMLIGNKLVVTNDNEIVLAPVWSLHSPRTEIIAVNTRHAEERVHSAGRVLSDRSVLFKYMNPNLALVIAKGLDSTAKTFINVYLLDLVTGKVFYSASHKKVLPPFLAIHSENWGVYSFYNAKARRTEMVSIELYEGKSQMNASVFSSVDNPVTPLVERQAYILPASDITAMTETLTEQGITSKHILIGTSLGSIIDLPLHMLDPRRPSLDSPMHVREPGIPPYIPELSVPHESIMNYNQTLLGVQNIVTSPSGLESTTLVVVHGLDMFGSRVTPSKGFDLLKEDFDYLMISAVILGLVLASYVTRKLSQKKMLANAWK